MAREAFSRFILFTAVCVLAGNGIALASIAAKAPQGNSPSAQAESDSHTCLAPAILASGGLCCPGTQSSLKPCISSKPAMISTGEARLKPVIVNGVHIPLPIVLQMYKRSLGKTWSTAVADRNVMVCEFKNIPGTRVPLLHCNTNYVHFKGFVNTNTHISPADRKVHCYYNCFLTRENIINSLVRYVDNDIDTAKVLGSLLGKASAANATYSLRVAETVPMRFPKQHVIIDKPAYVTFVIGNGRLVDIQLSERQGKAKIERNYKQPRQRVYVGPSGPPACPPPCGRM